MFNRNAKLTFVIACLVLIVGKFGLEYSAVALKVYLQKYPVEMRNKFPSIPDVVGSWRKSAEGRPMAKEEIEALGTELYLNRTYRTQDKSMRHPLHVHLAYYTGMIDAVPHVADRCLVAAGYEQQSLPTNYALKIDVGAWRTDQEHLNRKTQKPYPFVMHKSYFTGAESMIRMPLGEFELRTTQFSDPGDPDTRIFAGYLFVANGCTTAQPDRIRLLAFDRTDKYAYYCKSQFMMEGGRDLTRDMFLDSVSSFLNGFLPELMRCLPDWSEVESTDSIATREGSSPQRHRERRGSH